MNSYQTRIRISQFEWLRTAPVQAGSNGPDNRNLVGEAGCGKRLDL